MKLSAEMELAIRDIVEKERERSDRTYARKIIETGVIAILTFFTAAVMSQFVPKLLSFFGK